MKKSLSLIALAATAAIAKMGEITSDLSVFENLADDVDMLIEQA